MTSTTFTTSLTCPAYGDRKEYEITVSARVRKTYTERGIRYDVEDMTYDSIEHDGGEVAAWIVDRLPKRDRERLDDMAETALVEAQGQRRTA